MNEVSKDVFFKTLYADPRDIMPSIEQQRWDKETGYTSLWKDRNGNLFGKTNGNGRNDRYWLVKEPNQ
jgi:hypothetical protein